LRIGPNIRLFETHRRGPIGTTARGRFREFSRKNKARLNPPSKHVIAASGRQSPNMMETER